MEIDFVLNVPGHLDNIRTVYGFYRNGLVVDTPRTTDWEEIKIKGFENGRFGFCVFNIKHMIKDIIAYSGTVCIFEIQASIKKKKAGENKEESDQYQSLREKEPIKGYELFRYWGKNQAESDYIPQAPPEEDKSSSEYMPYAWTMSELF